MYHTTISSRPRISPPPWIFAMTVVLLHLAGCQQSWLPMTNLSPPSNVAIPNSGFGSSIILNDQHAVVGAPDGEEGGFVFSYTLSGTSWIREPTLQHSTPANGDGFGFSLAMSNTFLLVGSRGCNVGSIVGAGCAFVYSRSASEWTVRQDMLTASVSLSDARFGASVAISSEIAAVGAPNAKGPASNVKTGVAYIFTRVQHLWESMATITASDGVEYDDFGNAVGVTEYYALVAATGASAGVVEGAGAVYLFSRSGVQWSQVQRITSSNPQSWKEFGYQLSLTSKLASMVDRTGALELYDFSVPLWLFGSSGPGAITLFTETFKYRIRTEVVDDLISGVVVDYNSDLFTRTKSPSASPLSASRTSSRSRTGSRSRTRSRSESMSRSLSASRSVSRSRSRSRSRSLTKSRSLSNSRSVSVSISPFVRAKPCDRNRPSQTTTLPNSWVEIATISAPDGESGWRFGSSVSIARDYCIVGSPGATTSSYLGAGAAYIFSRSSQEWTFYQKLTSPDLNNNDCFGCSVGITQTQAVVGAPGAEADSIYGSGKAYVFTRIGLEWVYTQRLSSSDASRESYFGVVSSISRFAIWVADRHGVLHTFSKSSLGWIPSNSRTSSLREITSTSSFAITGHPSSNDNAGVAKIFVDPKILDSVNWVQFARITSSDGAIGSLFGASAAVAGNVVVVGAPAATVAGQPIAGCAYVYSITGLSWVQLQRLTATVPAFGSKFGESVALSDQYAVIGAPSEDIEDFIDAGCCFIYKKNGVSWGDVTTLTAPEASDIALFGSSLVIDSDLLAVGAPGATPTFELNEGAVYVYSLVSGSWAYQSTISSSNSAQNLQFGITLYGSQGRLNIGAQQGQQTHVFVLTDSEWGFQSIQTSFSMESLNKTRTEYYRITTDPSAENGKGAVFVEYNSAIITPTRKSFQKRNKR
eukprot:TRINITY_DN9590_c0_g1_i1.p1 TRINITY_DN9590_c0_g1~~TRINITY_DN9590_c0_g1_i1.p1  ORF type:complete len:927 (-),score=143.05 TRINITY_DN9590_c0_g1_i1:277-3057(-)